MEYAPLDHFYHVVWLVDAGIRIDLIATRSLSKGGNK